jgi:hypothetical protein
MTAAYPDIETPESSEGSAAHEIGAMMIGQYSRGQEPRPREYIGTTLSNGHLVTEEEFEAAQIYAQDVRDVMRATRIFGGGLLGVEAALHAPDVHPESFGTCDCFIFNRNAGHLWIWEYKHGHGIVEAFENWQMINYLSGIITRYGIDGHEDQLITVHARVVQPRAYHRDGDIREWSFKLSDIRPHINILHDNAALALSPGAPIRSGIIQCRYCAARHECPAAREAGIGMFEITQRALSERLSAGAIGTLYALILRAKKQLDYLESGIEEEIKSRIKAGENIPGCLVEEGFGREAWTAPVAEIMQLGELMGVNLKKEEVITPAQAKKAGLDPAIVATYSNRPNRGFKVVIDNNQKARRVFYE